MENFSIYVCEVILFCLRGWVNQYSKKEVGDLQQSNNFIISISEGKSKIPFGNKTNIAPIILFLKLKNCASIGREYVRFQW